MPLSAITALILAVFCTWVGQGTPPPNNREAPLGKESPASFAVAGFSMAPTLLGRSKQMECRQCAHIGYFPIQAAEKPAPCPQCGGSLRRTGEIRPPDKLFRCLSKTPLHHGDLVAIKLADQEVVKRIVGVPGDVIDVQTLQLTNHGQPIQQMLQKRMPPLTLPSVLVYRDTGQGKSRWKRQGQWWVYHHVNPYRGGSPSRVRDDYAVNLNLSRRLEPADDLLVRDRGMDHGTETRWTDQDWVQWRPGKGLSPPSVSSHDSPVSETAPLAIRNRHPLQGNDEDAPWQNLSSARNFQFLPVEVLPLYPPIGRVGLSGPGRAYDKPRAGEPSPAATASDPPAAREGDIAPTELKVLPLACRI